MYDENEGLAQLILNLPIWRYRRRVCKRGEKANLRMSFESKQRKLPLSSSASALSVFQLDAPGLFLLIQFSLIKVG